MFICLFLGLMCFYTYERRIRPTAKYAIEAAFLVGTVAISTIIKVCVSIVAENISLNLSFFISALYAALGGLTFEGAAYGLSDIGSRCMSYLYYGSSIFAGAVFISVISFKASYEFFSYAKLKIILFCLSFLQNFKKEFDVYVFTSLTEDTIAFANDIAREYAERRVKGKKAEGEKAEERKENSRFFIIFAGYELNPFDRKVELCRDVQENSYYYWSLNEEKEKEKGRKSARSLLCRLHLDGFSHVHVFAYSLDDKLKANEDENDRIVFEEADKLYCERIELLRRKHVSKKENEASSVHFYMLTKNSVDYSVFNRRIIELRKKAERGTKDVQSTAVKEFLFEHHDTIIKLSFDVGQKKDKGRAFEEYNALSAKAKALNALIKKARDADSLIKAEQDELALIKKEMIAIICNCMLSVVRKGESNGKNEPNFFKLLKDFLNNRKDCGIKGKSASVIKLKKEFDNLSKHQELCSSVKGCLNRMIQFKINNEADLSAKDFVNKRYVEKDAGYNILMYENGLYVNGMKPVLHEDVKVDEKIIDPVYKVMNLGFGEAGQSAMLASYYDSAFVYRAVSSTGKKEVKPTQFLVDVYDSNIDELSGIFIKTHPMFVAVSEDCDLFKKEKSERDINKSRKDLSEKIRRASKEVFEEFYKEEYIGGPNITESDDITLPCICFHKRSCKSKDFFTFLDRATGSIGECKYTEEAPVDAKVCGYCLKNESKDRDDFNNIYDYDTIIIALGNDRDNITVANALIRDIRRELIKEMSEAPNKTIYPRYQTIVVNIREKRNEKLLESIDKNEILHQEVNGTGIVTYLLGDYLKVIPFGASADTYTYNNIVYTLEDEDYNVAYNRIGEITPYGYDVADVQNVLKESDNGKIKSNVTKVEETGQQSLSIKYSQNGIVDKEMVNNYFYDVINYYKDFVKTEPAKTNLDNLNDNFSKTCSIIKRIQLFKDAAGIISELNRTKKEKDNWHDSWYSLSLFQKESNYAARSFAKRIRAAAKLLVLGETENEINDSTKTDSLYCLAMLEHERWMRFYIAHGWVYKAPPFDKSKCEHDCIIGFSNLRPDTVQYDIINIALALICVKAEECYIPKKTPETSVGKTNEISKDDAETTIAKGKAIAQG